MLSELLTRTIAQFLNVLMFLILAQAAMSWFVRDTSNPIFKFLTEIAIEIGLYKLDNYENNPIEYCGMMLSSNILI